MAIQQEIASRYAMLKIVGARRAVRVPEQKFLVPLQSPVLSRHY